LVTGTRFGMGLVRASSTRDRARNRLAIRRRTRVRNSGISKDDIMRSHRLARRVAAYAGGAAVVAMVGLTAACGSSSDKAPETTTPSTTTAPSSSAPSVTPTEKSINPTGGNLFTPPVKAPPAPTAIPGDN
jgi:hypothetical protein